MWIGSLKSQVADVNWESGILTRWQSDGHGEGTEENHGFVESKIFQIVGWAQIDLHFDQKESWGVISGFNSQVWTWILWADKSCALAESSLLVCESKRVCEGNGFVQLSTTTGNTRNRKRVIAWRASYSWAFGERIIFWVLNFCWLQNEQWNRWNLTLNRKEWRKTQDEVESKILKIRLMNWHKSVGLHNCSSNS